VKAAFISMVNEPEGRQILQAGADLLKSSGELGFVAAENREYDNYRKFYRATQLK
jgi:phosphonate transport system substrate-binding protein